MHPSSRYLRAMLGGCLGLLLAACGNTPLAPAFGSGCLKGPLQAGDTLTGAFTSTSCVLDQDFWSGNTVPYETYDIQLTRGKAYHLYLQAIPDTANQGTDNVDARLTLWGRSPTGEPIPLASSDDEADGTNSELWFVAPAGGTFTVVASSYDFGEFGGYRLMMNECPVLGALDTAGTYQFALPPSPCWRHGAGNRSADTSAFAFVTLNAVPGELFKTSVTTGAFPPTWEEFGPGFDTYANLYNDSRNASARGSGSTASMTMGAVGGQVTIGVGATTVDSAGGAFTLTLTRTPPPAPPAPGSEWSLATAAQMTMGPRPAPKPH